MAKWQDTYEELKKRKKAIDKTSSASERQTVSNTYKNNTGYQNNLITTKNNIDKNNVAYVKNTNTPKQVAALTTKKSEEKKWYQNIINLDNAKNIVNTKPFDDGYDFGDVTKAILGTKRNINQTVGSTVLDVGAGILKGASDIGVAGAKLVSGGVAQVADWVGEDEYAEKVRKRIAGKDEETNKFLENKTPSGLLEKANKELDKKSILGETADEITGGLGYYAGMLAAQSVGVPWQVTAGVTSAGNELGNAYANGADDWEAWASSLISAGAEIGSEYLFGGVKLPGTGKTADKIFSKATDKIKNKALKYITQAGLQMAGEGAEEVISGYGQTIGRTLTYMSDKEVESIAEDDSALEKFFKRVNDQYSLEDAIKDFSIAAAVSGLTIGGNPSTYRNIKTGRSLISGLTTEEANVIEQETKKRIDEIEKNGIKLTDKEKEQIEERVKQELYTTENETQSDIQQENTENTENSTENTDNLQSSAVNIAENNAINKKLNNIVTQMNQLESQLDTSQNAVQQQEILNQIDVLEQKYNEILQQEQNTGLPVQDIQPKELQTNEDIAPIQEVTQKEISKPTTREVNSNLTTEVESNTPKDVKSNSNIEVGKNNQNTVNKEVNNEVNQVEERKVIDNNIFAKQVDEVINGTYPKRDMLVVSEKTPKILQDIGLKDLPITMTQKHLYTMMNESGKYKGVNYHNIDPEIIKQIPDALERPLNILQSDTRDDSIVVVTELSDKNNDIIVASIKIDGEGRINDIKIDSNVLTSAYGKSNNYDYFMKNNIEKGNLLYDIDEGVKKRVIRDRLQSSMQDNSSDNNLTQETKNVKSSTKYNMQQNGKNNTNSTPTQQELDNLEDIRQNKSGSEYASAFYDLEKKYGKENLYKGLNEYKSTGKAITNEQVVKQVSEQVEDAVAPIQKSIKELKETIAEVKKVAEETKTITEADLEDFYRFTRETASNEAPIENNNLYQKDINQEYAPTPEVESPLQDRNIDEVGNRSVKAYQYEHPEVRPYFQQMAKYMLTDLENSTKGERFSLGNDSNAEWSGTTRNTTDDIADLLDNFNYTYADIRKGLEAIIKDHGAENIAVAKRIEFALDERLRNGYTDVSGLEIPADQNYINMLKEQEWTNYYDSIPTENIAPFNENIEDNTNIPTNENVFKKPLKERYEAIEPNKANEDKYEDTPMIRVKPDKTAFEKRVMESAKEIEKELGYIPKDPTKKSSYDLTDTSENKRVAEILTEEPKATKKNQRLWATMKANILDKGAVFEDLSIKTKNRNLMGKWDYTLTSEARAQNVIGNGHKEYDSSTKTMKQTSKSLNDIVAEVENTGLKKEFYDYMYHKHNVDRMNLEQRAKEKIFDLNNMLKETTNEADKKDIEREIKSLEKTINKPVFGDSVTSDVSQRVVEQYENENPVFMDYAQDVYDYVNADRQQLVKEGVISQETADLWSEMYPHYVPIRRVDSNGNNIDVPLDTGRTGINAPIKKATGGSSDILPLFDTMAMRTLQTYRATAKNSFGVELKNTLGTTIENQQTNIDEVIDSVDNQEGLLQDNNGKPTFTVFENGEKITYSITQDMYDALKPISESSILSKTFKPFNTASSFHRGLLTEYNPVFMITNAVKDIQDVLINSQHTAKTYSKLPEAYAQLVKKGYWYQEYISNGGEQNSYFDSQENTFKTENKGIKKLLDIPPLSTISKMNNFIEMAPRLAEYIASREQGRSIEVSMLDAARVTTNFKAGGNVTKWANRNGATFLNASVQGAMQQVRNIREANMNGLRGWANLATKFTIAGLPALLLNGLMWDDDDDYEELSDYVKQNYYVVWKKDDGTFIRIPKGRTVAVIQDAIQQIENAKTGDDEVDLKSFLDLVLTNLAPNNPLDNNILSPIFDVAQNKTWYEGDLVPTRLQNLPANEQYDESTDMFSRWLGDKLNISPIKINYILDQYSGGVGDVVLPIITPEATSGAETLGEQLLAPLTSKFTTNATMNNKNVGNLYETSEKLTTNAKKSEATDEDVLKNKFINSIKSEMNELYKQKREVQNSDLSKGEKYEQVLEIQSQINELSKYGLNNYEDVNISGNYASVGNRQYKLNSNDEWEKINDKQIAKQEEVSNSLNISPSEYWSNKEEYDYAYENPGKYALATAITDYDTYKTYSKDIYELKADKDEDGKSISGSRKEKVISYVNELDLSIPQKAMLIRQTYSSFDDYNDEIVNYVADLDIDYDTKKAILEALDMKVYDDGSVGW